MQMYKIPFLLSGLLLGLVCKLVGVSAFRSWLVVFYFAKQTDTGIKADKGCLEFYGLVAKISCWDFWWVNIPYGIKAKLSS